MEYWNGKTEEELAAESYHHATILFDCKEQLRLEVDSIGELADLLTQMHKDKSRQDARTDSTLEYEDPIVSIEQCEVEDTMDITVSSDNLFYANGILTKNSIGLPATLDWFVAITTDEVLQANNQQLLHLLKTRWGGKSGMKSQLIGIDWPKMRYYDVGSTEEVVNKVGQRKPAKTRQKDTAAIDWD
jgi:hypothetical protein